MPIDFRCTRCDKLLRTPEDKAGRNAICPECGTSVTIPSPDRVDYDLGDDEEIREESTTPENRFDRVFAVGSQSPVSTAAGTKVCPMCGETIQRAAIRCRYCGEDFDRGLSHRTDMLTPHRGAVILLLSILGWVLCLAFGLGIVLGIVAWAMGNHDLAEMRAGRMDPRDDGLTNAGRIVGMIQCILGVVVLLILLVILTGGGVL